MEVVAFIVFAGLVVAIRAARVRPTGRVVRLAPQPERAPNSHTAPPASGPWTGHVNRSSPPPSSPERQPALARIPPARQADPAQPCAGSIVQGRCWVTDGDTIVIGEYSIRLAGIDAPELDHPWGQKAKWALVGLCRGQIVKAHVTGEISHNRLVAVCYLLDGRDLSAEMVRLGHAIDWPKYSDGRYGHLEGPEARKRLWRADARQKGRFPPPGD